MSAIELPIRDPFFRTLRVIENLSDSSFWCHMHARMPGATQRGRPCFSTLLLEDLRAFQSWASDRIVRRGVDPGRAPLTHLVLASDAEVFNLGGDLALFVELIRARDRAWLLRYARQCIEVAYGFQRLCEAPVHSIALIQGDALGGGFEAALCCHTIIAEQGVGMGFPEVLFDLFPGMGAYSFLSRRIPPMQAERMMLDGRVYSTDELYRLGVVDMLVPKGEAPQAARELIKRNLRIPHARQAMHRVRRMCQPVALEELMAVTEVWVDTALQLGDKALGVMERLVRAQNKRFVQAPARGGNALQLQAG
jgi:DSF synthase